ncbi:hypothetical protein FTUN_0360 [Frigoriglobus tundricola]|uniref:Uncharacterized protein n=1 Tax=Frigoriglobus tundricola TaxID=2774151 RepID=A0A6M5YHX6_9BACT|nr:hypothetical protein FTUN_0360 [Frigoriglobus tundricola]
MDTNAGGDANFHSGWYSPVRHSASNQMRGEPRPAVPELEYGDRAVDRTRPEYHRYNRV